MKMKINNAFSTKMLLDEALEQGITIRFSKITEKEFREAIARADTIAMGHEDSARYFGLEEDRKTLHLHKGDVLFLCEANAKDGGRLPSGTQFLAEMGKSWYFRFIKAECL